MKRLSRYPDKIEQFCAISRAGWYSAVAVLAKEDE